MSEIPEDVMAVVDGIGLELFGDTSFIFKSDREYVARAIMAERERAAKVAEDYRTSDEPSPGHAIAAAIRRGDA